MDYVTPLGIIVLAGLIHASLQLGISMMTLLSGHSLSAKRSAARTLGLVASFFCGSFVMIMLIVSFIAYALTQMMPHGVSSVAWTAASSTLLSLGVITWMTYYRPGKEGTELWIPRVLARFLAHRTKVTHDGAEAFSLGLTSVLAEFIFAVPPAFAAALALLSLPGSWQLPGLAVYTLIASMGLGIVVVLIGSGHRISAIQRWREAHKRFLQFAAGGGMVVLGFFIYVTYFVTPALAGSLK